MEAYPVRLLARADSFKSLKAVFAGTLFPAIVRVTDVSRSPCGTAVDNHARPPDQTTLSSLAASPKS
ncbi:hypothetical protein WFJ45_24055, partial [Salmonella enterica subsp. enterica serovar Minnesota]|uniref:hypothetical protein n=1 Tax=Salmonella enterica TaxID=28901 RepID=UPI003D294B8F